MIVITPHYTGALVARQTEDGPTEGTPLVEFIYTHDRNAIIAAARGYLDNMRPQPACTQHRRPAVSTGMAGARQSTQFGIESASNRSEVSIASTSAASALTFAT